MGMNARMGQQVQGSDAANYFTLELAIGDISLDASYYKVVPFNGRLIRAYSVITGAVLTADSTITFAKGATNLTVAGGGAAVITHPTAGSAAGDIAQVLPVAGNTFLQGEAIKLTAAGAGSASTGPGLRVTMIFERTGE